MGSRWKCRTYYNVNPFIGLSYHDTVISTPLPPFFIPGKLWHWDFSVVQGLWIGAFLSNGRGKSIISDDLLLVGRMNDAGLIVPHLSMPPTWFNLLTTLFGGSTVLFGSSSVSLACKNIIWGNEDCDIGATPFGPVPFSLNLSCGDPISLPTDLVVVWGTVYVGMSGADLLCAFIDFAISIVMEVVMAVGCHYGGKLLGKLFKGSAKGAAKKAVKKAVANRVKKAMWSSFTSAVGNSKAFKSLMKFVGATPTDAALDYAKKAAKTKGILNNLKDMSMSLGKNVNVDVQALVKQGQPGVFAKNFGGVVDNLDTGIAKYADDYGKKLKFNKLAKEGWDSVSDELKNLKKLSFMTDDIAVDNLERTVLWKSLKELSDAAEKAASTEAACLVGRKLITKTLSKILWKNTIVNGDLIHIAFTVPGTDYEYDYSTGAVHQWSDKWYANPTYFGKEFWDIGVEDDGEEWYGTSGAETDTETSGATSSTTSAETSSTTSAETTESDDDYWYWDENLQAAAEAGETDTSDDDDDDEDDYWYGDEADAASA